MDGYTDYSIQEMPLGTPFFRLRVERFLRENALSLEEVDVYYAVLDKEDNIIAGAGLHRDIIKCVAVAPAFRSDHRIDKVQGMGFGGAGAAQDEHGQR